MRTNHVKEKLTRGQSSIGGWLALASVGVARLMARQGFDWLTVDMEHSALDPVQMNLMVAAIAETGQCAPFVRVPHNSVEWFKWALDAGAWGVIVPMVSTREQALQAADWMRYPPRGSRSFGGTFAPYSFAATREEYMAVANDQTLLIVQIEGTEALNNLDTIVSVPGIDVVFVGPFDLHAQMGLTPSGEGREPEFVAAVERIKAAARQHNLPLGIYSSNGQAAARRITEGFQLVSAASDQGCLTAAAQQQLRSVLEQQRY